MSKVLHQNEPHLLLLSVLGALNGHHDFVADLRGRGDLRLKLELEPLLGADPLEHLGHFHVDAHAADVAQKLDCRHLQRKSDT